MTAKLTSSRRQRGITLFGLMFWAILIGITALVVMRVLPTVNEYYTIQRAVDKIAGKAARRCPRSAPPSRSRNEIEYSISSIGGKDLQITKENDRSSSASPTTRRSS